MISNKWNIRLLLLLLLSVPLAWSASGPASTASDLVAAVQQDNPIGAISATDLREIYLGEKTYFGNGLRAKPSLQQEESPVTREFIERVLNETPEGYRRLWRRKLFSGGGIPPVAFQTPADVLDYVFKTPGAIGIVAPGAQRSGTKLIPIR